MAYDPKSPRIMHNGGMSESRRSGLGKVPPLSQARIRILDGSAEIGFPTQGPTWPADVGKHQNAHRMAPITELPTPSPNQGEPGKVIQ
ncbi:hypothetical protein GQ607_016772 [Colletotrichum asianum]|uniref:Uncharacterized protein n=1 Tax=Colletotrichum asianum TaxID=702518 RepID=A0A8H3ZED5_9PEZI|nr:hypothetical protein GQ607_016772 [Colletotrichum asianum]